jgi:hypothetical protein
LFLTSKLSLTFILSPSGRGKKGEGA